METRGDRLAVILYRQRTLLLTIQRDIAYQLSLTDALTQLANRRRLDLVLSFEFEVASRYKRPLSIIMGDIDFFKRFNDTYHHMAGDELLKKLARLMRTSLRKVDLVVRFGGDEFTIIMPNTAIEGAKVVAEKIRKAIESEKFYPIPGQDSVPVTISLGVAEYPTHAKTKEELIDYADTALYAAKQAGRNCTITYSSSMKSAPG